MNRSEARSALVVDGGAPTCPACGSRYLVFRTDRSGRTYEQCPPPCGHRAYIERRTGRREPPPPSS